MHGRFATWALLVLTTSAVAASAHEAPRPNVLLIMTDDQGWGDVGFHGNAQIHTPHLDRLAGQSVELTRFYVSPVCSPTRASLMTGRYNYRTGAIDTYLGRSTMAADETTLAEMLQAAGYRTGIFGKWHLGDNYPSRAMDQGFEESLVHRGGGIGQPADPPGNHYFDPILLHNGQESPSRGYCSDVFTDAALRFIARADAKPFFAYVAFNCPHTPLEVPDEYHRRNSRDSLDDATAKLYGMVENIDDNVGRLLAELDKRGLAENTIVIFLTDNGPQQRRFNGPLKDLKGSVHEGGIRVPFLLRWPGRAKAGAQIDAPAAHIDIAPTLLAACRAEVPTGAALDGINLIPLIAGEQTKLPDRTLFFQWHRGDQPRLDRACAARGPRYKLVQPAGRDEQREFAPAWALYDLLEDPGEQHNLIAERPEIAAELKASYHRWFADVSATRGYPVPRIVVGTSHENPVVLTRQDWRGERAGWADSSLGHWQIDVAAAGEYDLTLHVAPGDAPRVARLRLGDDAFEREVAAGATKVRFEAITLPRATIRLEASVGRSGADQGAHYVEVSCRKPQD